VPARLITEAFTCEQNQTQLKTWLLKKTTKICINLSGTEQKRQGGHTEWISGYAKARVLSNKTTLFFSKKKKRLSTWTTTTILQRFPRKKKKKERKKEEVYNAGRRGNRIG
jgi:hypothetical protein